MFHGLCEPSWELTQRSTVRGYYAGRYTDNNQVNLQLELRQRIYGRLGAVVWGGCGTVFPSFRGFKWSHLLFNYGLGLRFEFKHNVNLRGRLWIWQTYRWFRIQRG